MTDDKCNECPIPSEGMDDKDRLQTLEELIHDLRKDDELITRKVVLEMRSRSIRPETVVRYMRELLVADLVIAAHQRVGKLHPPDLQELERLMALLGAIGGTNEAVGVLLNERGLRLRNTMMEKLKGAEIMAIPGLTGPGNKGEPDA